MEKLKSWHVFDPTDFDGIVIDATKWEDNMYTLAFNFYCTKEKDEEPQSGITLCTMLFGSTLQECHERIMEVLDTGIFDEIEIASNGTVYDREGNEIEEICWNQFADENEEEPEETKVLH